mmetsp:Transcript_7021/g.21371  ORF Transcript_7021/g.21371 Transcript_7021/m.21371 type:complete len:229 (+) Transcript_7021:235-921(+)
MIGKTHRKDNNHGSTKETSRNDVQCGPCFTAIALEASQKHTKVWIQQCVLIERREREDNTRGVGCDRCDVWWPDVHHIIDENQIQEAESKHQIPSAHNKNFTMFRFTFIKVNRITALIYQRVIVSRTRNQHLQLKSVVHVLKRPVLNGEGIFETTSRNGKVHVTKQIGLWLRMDVELDENTGVVFQVDSEFDLNSSSLGIGGIGGQVRTERIREQLLVNNLSQFVHFT